MKVRLYKLIWNKEVIEDEIQSKDEALYLRAEYALAYGGIVTIEQYYEN